MNEVKRTQEEVHDALAPPDSETSPPGIKTLAELTVDADGLPTHSLEIVIHCALLETPDDGFTVEDLYNRLTDRFPGLAKNEPELKVPVFPSSFLLLS